MSQHLFFTLYIYQGLFYIIENDTGKVRVRAVARSGEDILPEVLRPVLALPRLETRRNKRILRPSVGSRSSRNSG